MRDQATVAVYDVGIASLANLDRFDHVPDQFQVGLGHGDAASPTMGDRDRDIRLARFAEINRPPIDTVCQRFDESRLSRPIDFAADHIHEKSRNFELFAAVPVELDQFGDRRHLTQQTDIVEASLIDRQLCPVCLGYPPNLTLDLPDEGFNTLAGGFGLLPLQLSQERLGLLPSLPHVHRALDEHGAAHKQQGWQHQFADRNAQHGHGSLPNIEGNERGRSVLRHTQAWIDGASEQHHIRGGGEVTEVRREVRRRHGERKRTKEGARCCMGEDILLRQVAEAAVVGLRPQAGHGKTF